MRAQKITKSIFKKLYTPSPDSHKGDNGLILIIAGSKKYHGSLVLSAVMAAKIVDLVSIASTEENFKLLSKLRHNLAEFIFVEKKELKNTLGKVDSVLVGPGMMPDASTKKIINEILRQYPNKRIVIDAAALRVMNLDLLHSNCILTPHAGEFEDIFCLRASVQNLIVVSKRYPAVIILKGKIDYVAQGGRLFYNTTGNTGMTKGGTGDVLAGLTAALAAKNDALTASAAAVYLNGLAGDRLKPRFGFFYSASELIPQVQTILGAI